MSPSVILPPILSIFSSENDGMLTRTSNVIEERYLGIIFDGDLKFASHVDQIVMKANRVYSLLEIIKFTFVSIDANTIRLLCVTLVCPISDYSSTAWNPYLMTNICKLEAVQRRATKPIPSFYNMSYSEGL